MRAYYTYVDADGARVPRHAASRIQIEAHNEEAVGPLDPLQHALSEMPGCIAAEQVSGDDPNVVKWRRARPARVIATFEEQYVTSAKGSTTGARAPARSAETADREPEASEAVARILTRAENDARDRARPRAFVPLELARAVYRRDDPTARQLSLVRQAAERLVSEGRAQRRLRAGSWEGSGERRDQHPDTSGYSHIELDHDGVTYSRVPTAADRRLEAEAKAERKALVKKVGLRAALNALEAPAD